MQENFVDVALETTVLLLYGLGALLATLAGVAIEYFSVLHLLTGEYPMAGYFGILGLVILGFAFLIFSNELLPTLRAT